MQNGEGGTRAARSPWDIDASLCGILSFLFTWNWIVSQSPTSLTVEWGAWRIPARAILLVSFAVAGFTLFALRRYRPVAAPKIRRVRSITVAMVLAAGILVPDILDGRFDGELAGALRGADDLHGRGKRLPHNGRRHAIRTQGHRAPHFCHSGICHWTASLRAAANRLVLRARQHSGRRHGGFSRIGTFLVWLASDKR